MARISKSSKQKVKPEPDKKKCSMCQELKRLDTSYYMSHSVAHGDGRLTICKECLQEIAGDFTDVDKIKKMLQLADKPYIPHLIEAVSAKNSPVGELFKLLNAKDFRHMTWSDSYSDVKKNNTPTNSTNHSNSKPKEVHPSFHFDITPEMIIRWGQNYAPEDYIKLEDFYHKMRMSNRIETPQDETYLKKLAVISVKMDQELEAGNYGQVKQLGDLFSKYMADSKFRAMDKTEADKTGGIRNFGTIYAEVEKDGHIPPWEQFRKIKGLKQDFIDRTIMHIENFTLRLNKIDRMTQPPSDTPKLTSDDTDMVDGDES